NRRGPLSADGGSSHHRADLGAACQSVVRRPRLRPPRGGATLQRGGLHDRRPAALCGRGPRQLEGQTRRGQRSGGGDGAGATGRDPVAGGADPPATISFHATAVVYPAGSPEARSRLRELGSLVPTARRGARPPLP